MTNATPPEEIMNIEAVNGEHPASVKHIGMWICKNLACKAVLRPEDSFCNKCSCYICHRFDVKKDESLWLVCTSEEDKKNSCGSSFHIECLLQHKRVGCFSIEKTIHLDGSISCFACGKISGMLGYLKRQLVIAKDARRLNSLCDHIFLVCRLLEGTSRFKELLEIVEDAKVKLESEVGPLDGMSAKMAQGIVRRSSTGIDVQKLCTTAIQKADEWLTSPDPHLQDSLPTACIFNFTDATSSSITIILKETLPSDTVKGYKLWYWKSKKQPTMENPLTVPKDKRQILVFNLSPCTEYSFRAISFTDEGIFGHSESRCYTRSKEIYFKRATQNTIRGGSQMQPRNQIEPFKENGFKIRNILKTFQKKWPEEGCFQGLYENMHECSCSRNATEAQMTVSSKQELLSYRKLGVNASSTRQLSEDYEDVIKLLRQLECHGHIDSDFRKKFMTWYSLRSTDQEGRAVSTLIETLGEDPNGLAEQLVDAFGEIIALKKPRT